MEARIDKIVRYLMPYRKFINCHMVAYFTENHFENFISPEIREQISDDLPKVIENLMQSGYNIEGYPALMAFVQESKLHTLPEMKDICLTIDEFQKKRNISQSGQGIHVKEFMSAKKCHEVEVTSKFVYDLCKSSELVVIDAGDGKGYLSSRLALEYRLPVLGIDSSTINTRGAEKRSTKLTKAWNMLVTKAEQRNAGIEPQRIGRRRSKVAQVPRDTIPALYQTVTQFIDHTTDLEVFVKDKFPEHTFEQFCLTGLHTCGNLAANCLNIFNKNSKMKILCNVGCCYHLLDEPGGFPLSKHLQQQGFSIGRNARMLASQSANRFFHEKELPHKSLLHRAMLEVILCRKIPDDVRKEFTVGKSKVCADFVEYVENSFKKFDMEPPSKEEILLVQMEYEQQWDQMKFFYLFRIFLAPVIESLILLDRVLYLHESGIKDSYIVHLFDSVVSPRCYGIVSIKD